MTDAETLTGVVTRICDFKYGFIRHSPELPNLFFHFSELSDEAKALVSVGARVTFTTATNKFAGNKQKAVNINVDDVRENALQRTALRGMIE